MRTTALNVQMLACLQRVFKQPKGAVQTGKQSLHAELCYIRALSYARPGCQQSAIRSAKVGRQALGEPRLLAEQVAHPP